MRILHVSILLPPLPPTTPVWTEHYINPPSLLPDLQYHRDNAARQSTLRHRAVHSLTPWPWAIKPVKPVMIVVSFCGASQKPLWRATRVLRSELLPKGRRIFSTKII
jgi:hypothetical protein